MAFIAAYHNSSNSTSTGVAVTIAAGQSLLIFGLDGDASGQTLTVTDTLGNTYVQRISQNDAYNGSTYVLFDCLSPTTGSTTISVNHTTTAHIGIIVAVFDTFSSFDNAVSAWQHSGWAITTNGAQSPSITPAGAGETLIGFATGQGGTIANDTAATDNIAGTTAMPNGQPAYVEGYESVAAGATTANFTFSSATASNAIIAAFYVPSGGAAYTLTAAEGSFALTGEAATLTYTHGTAYTLSAATGYFTMTGEPAARDLAMGAAQGSFAMTGYPVSAQYGINPSTGLFSLTGFSAALSWSGGQTALYGVSGPHVAWRIQAGSFTTNFSVSGPAVTRDVSVSKSTN